MELLSDFANVKGLLEWGPQILLEDPPQGLETLNINNYTMVFFTALTKRH